MVGPMDVISLDEYRRTGRIQIVTARERYKQALKEKVRKRLRARMRLQKLEEKQSGPPTKK